MWCHGQLFWEYSQEFYQKLKGFHLFAHDPGWLLGCQNQAAEPQAA